MVLEHASCSSTGITHDDVFVGEAERHVSSETDYEQVFECLPNDKSVLGSAVLVLGLADELCHHCQMSLIAIWCEDRDILLRAA
jgi:hypothetical protein